MVADSPRVDPRTRRTREQLKQALGALMREKNIASISVRDITETAQVNRATFYAHFPDKLALLEACVAEWFEEKLQARGCSPQFDLDQLRSLVYTLRDFLRCWNRPHKMANREFHPMMEATLRCCLHGHLCQLLPSALPEFRDSPHLLDAGATLWSWSIFGAATRLAHGEQDEPGIAEAMLQLLGRRLPDAGRPGQTEPLL